MQYIIRFGWIRKRHEILAFFHQIDKMIIISKSTLKIFLEKPVVKTFGYHRYIEYLFKNSIFDFSGLTNKTDYEPRKKLRNKLKKADYH